MSFLRKDGIVGIIDFDVNTVPMMLHFSEWANGEGLSFSTSTAEGDDEREISLHLDEIQALAVAAYVSGFLDLNELKEQAKKIKNECKLRENSIKQIVEDFNEKESSKKKKCTCAGCSSSCFSSANR